MHDGKLSSKRVFALEHDACEQVQRQEQGLRCVRLAHDEGRGANAHANEERKRVLPDGTVPSDAHFQVELVDNETSDVVARFPEHFILWSCKELVDDAFEASPAPALTHTG